MDKYHEHSVIPNVHIGRVSLICFIVVVIELER